MSFEINYNSSFAKISELKAELIGYFSIDGEECYHPDLSQLKYYIPPEDPNNVHFDLDQNKWSTHHKPGSYIKLNDILRWISENYNVLEKPLSLSVHQNRWLDVEFICRRGALKTLLCSPYERREGWIICASKYHDTIYLCEYYSNEREQEHTTQTIVDKQFSSRGFKFEQFMMADHPLHKPNPSQPLNECEEFRCVFKAQFGGYSLLYGAEIDGIFSQKPITDTIIGKKFEFIELKTLPMYNNDSNIYGKFEPSRVLKSWSQNYLIQIDKLVCGLKDKNLVKMVKEYSTDSLPKLSKVDCDLHKCKMFCKLFLDNIKRIVTKDHDECIYMFQWSPYAKYTIKYKEEQPNHPMYSFLSSEFVAKTEKYRSISGLAKM